ncbi:MAG TPA: phosphopantetheine-binding protein [Saprospiraceae bacterium]|nr:phosphopantetheine-binding protein [Saprospiraceae bacterium]HQW56796.1 phosphopantetheine-binding protein [Saprospiraceae bacterium]
MNEDKIISTINGFLAEEFEADLSLFRPEANMKETLDLDSLDFVDLVVLIEKNFGFKINAEEFTKMKTFQDLYSYVSQRLHQSTPVR